MRREGRRARRYIIMPTNLVGVCVCVYVESDPRTPRRHDLYNIHNSCIIYIYIYIWWWVDNIAVEND